MSTWKMVEIYIYTYTTFFNKISLWIYFNILLPLKDPLSLICHKKKTIIAILRKCYADLTFGVVDDFMLATLVRNKYSYIFITIHGRLFCACLLQGLCFYESSTRNPLSREYIRTCVTLHMSTVTRISSLIRHDFNLQNQVTQFHCRDEYLTWGFE